RVPTTLTRRRVWTISRTFIMQRAGTVRWCNRAGKPWQSWKGIRKSIPCKQRRLWKTTASSRKGPQGQPIVKAGGSELPSCAGEHCDLPRLNFTEATLASALRAGILQVGSKRIDQHPDEADQLDFKDSGNWPERDQRPKSAGDAESIPFAGR